RLKRRRARPQSKRASSKSRFFSLLLCTENKGGGSSDQPPVDVPPRTSSRTVVLPGNQGTWIDFRGALQCFAQPGISFPPSPKDSSPSFLRSRHISRPTRGLPAVQ